MLRDLATGQVRALTAELGPLGRLDRLGHGRHSSILVTAEDVMEAPVFRVDVADRQGHPADRRRPCRQRRSAGRRRRDLTPRTA